MEHSLIRVFDSSLSLTGGRHGESDQNQRERSVGGRVQRETGPLPLHPRSAAGAAAT